MNQLTPGIRTAIQLCELDERSLEESAQMIGVSVAAAKSRVLRGRRKLRVALDRALRHGLGWPVDGRGPQHFGRGLRCSTRQIEQARGKMIRWTQLLWELQHDWTVQQC
jgi:hypothetical protein